MDGISTPTTTCRHPRCTAPVGRHGFCDLHWATLSQPLKSRIACAEADLAEGRITDGDFAAVMDRVLRESGR